MIIIDDRLKLYFKSVFAKKHRSDENIIMPLCTLPNAFLRSMNIRTGCRLISFALSKIFGRARIQVCRK